MSTSAILANTPFPVSNPDDLPELKLPKLPYDVFQYISNHLGLTDVVHIMHTCRTLYDLGVQSVLKDVEYFPDPTKHTRWKLYNHFLRENPMRFIHVKTLTCLYTRAEYVVRSAYTFVDLLRSCQHIEYLDITFPPGIEVTDESIALIASLSQLKHLKLRWEAPYSRILQDLTAPLQSLEIDVLKGKYGSRSGSSLCPSLGTLHSFFPPPDRRFYSTLEEITFDFGPYTSYTRLDTPFPPNSVFFAARKLRWRSVELFRDRSALTSTYPALHHLDIRFSRFKNSSDQRNALSLLHGHGVWDPGHSFTFVSGDLCTLYALRLSTHVEHLEIDFYELTEHIMKNTRLMFPAIVKFAMHPSTFVLKLWSHCQVLRRGCLRTFLYDGLKDLKINVLLDESCLTYVVSELIPFFTRETPVSAHGREQRCSVKTLAITFDRMHFPDDAMNMGSTGGLPWAAQNVRVSWASLAHVVFAAVPSLKVVSFHATGLPDTVWRANSSEVQAGPVFVDGEPADEPTQAGVDKVLSEITSRQIGQSELSF